jgi:hypothetical protein
MSKSKQPKQTKAASPEKLAKPTVEAGIELSEVALNKASGGSLNFYAQFDEAPKESRTAIPNVVAPVVKPGG